MTPLILIQRRIMASLGIVLAWGALALAVPPGTRAPVEPLQLAQIWTMAACGQSLCDCGTARLISDQAAPCEVTSSAGTCSTGSGHCCICAAPRITVAVCANILCECDNSRLVMQTSAPCMVTSTAGTCSIGSGQCCVCALD